MNTNALDSVYVKLDWCIFDNLNVCMRIENTFLLINYFPQTKQEEKAKQVSRFSCKNENLL